MSETTMTFEQGLKMLIEESKQDKKPTQEKPQTIHLDLIHMAHSVFQPRQFEEGTKATSEDHTQGLVEAIINEPTHQLDPIVVWWSGSKWRVIDGAHRLMAYRRVNKKGRLRDLMIPVVVFQGDLYQAIDESIRLNSKDKLPMSKDDKINGAWRLTVLDKHTKPQIHSICKVGTTTIARMREVLILIQAKHPKDFFETALDMSWKEARNFGAKEIIRDDSWQEKQARIWADRLAKAYGTKASRQPAIFARAIELYSSRFPKDLLDYWSDDVKSFMDEYVEPDF
jgi:hypothetical protein